MNCKLVWNINLFKLKTFKLITTVYFAAVLLSTIRIFYKQGKIQQLRITKTKYKQCNN